MNDSIVKIIRNDTRWIPYTMDESEYWEEIDSTGNVTNNANYKVSHRKSKEKYKSEKRTIRNEQGCPVRVERMYIYHEKNDHSYLLDPETGKSKFKFE